MNPKYYRRIFLDLNYLQVSLAAKQQTYSTFPVCLSAAISLSVATLNFSQTPLTVPPSLTTPPLPKHSSFPPSPWARRDQAFQ